MSRYISPVIEISNINGAPQVGAKLCFYEPGSVSTKKAIYSDSGLTVAITNPATAVSSAAGAIYPSIFLDGLYSVVQQDASGTADTDDGSVIWSRDPVGELSAGQFDPWLTDQTYSIGDIVKGSDDSHYISLVATNQGNDPISSPTKWGLYDVATLTGTETFTDKTYEDAILTGDISGDAFLDEHDMLSDSSTKLSSQQSIKAYVDAKTATLNTKIIDIGDWDMSTATGSASVSVAHSLIYSKIRGVSVSIRNDADTFVFDFAADVNDVAGAGVVKSIGIDSTDVIITRDAGGRFDATGYDATSYNRGWIIIQHTD